MGVREFWTKLQKSHEESSTGSHYFDLARAVAITALAIGSFIVHILNMGRVRYLISNGEVPGGGHAWESDALLFHLAVLAAAATSAVALLFRSIKGLLLSFLAVVTALLAYWWWSHWWEEKHAANDLVISDIFPSGVTIYTQRIGDVTFSRAVGGGPGLDQACMAGLPLKASLISVKSASHPSPYDKPNPVVSNRLKAYATFQKGLHSDS